MYGTSRRLTMKPALSFVGTPSFPRLSVKPLASWKASSEVVMQRTTSTSFITCAGLKKCRPTKRFGRLVATPWSISRTTTSYPACAATWAIPCPMSPQPSTPTCLISTSLASSFSSAGSLHVTHPDRGPRGGTHARAEPPGEAQRAERRADPGAGRGGRGGGGRRLRPRGRSAGRGTDVLLRHGPGRPARALRAPGEPPPLPAADPPVVEP